MNKTELINEITNLLNFADVEISDFVCQFLQKSVDTTLQVTPLTEHSQPA
jgi:glycine cleavage system regulatory protein